MTTLSRTLFATIAVLFCLPNSVLAQWRTADKSQQLVRISKNRDGSSTQFKRNPANTVLKKETFTEQANGEKILRSSTLYRRDKHGKLRSGIIRDGQKTKLFRIVYGYHRDTGRLIAENMYDARVKRTVAGNPNKEEPVRATRYHYDALGKRSAPIVFTSQAGKSSEQLMKWLNRNKPGNDVDKDPFKKVPVNPNARAVGR